MARAPVDDDHLTATRIGDGTLPVAHPLTTAHLVHVGDIRGVAVGVRVAEPQVRTNPASHRHRHSVTQHVELGVGQVRDPQRRFAGSHGRGGKIGGLLQVLTRHGQVDRPADDLQTILAGSHRMTELLGSQPEAQHRGEYFQYHP